MASLHEALKSLGPCNWSDIPTSPEDLEKFVTDLFSKSQMILESIPIAEPDEFTRARSQTVSSVASNASEMSPSSARSAPPPPEYAVLQKEWGKPIKLSGKENPLHISVYKLGGKDGRGAWFARRSVHEGLGFARFKRGLEREFPESLAVHGAPGEGNIRGIGGEKKLESMKIHNKGKVEVYRLSAQFPGPTTPRDFVTFLVTSSKAMKDVENTSKVPELSPRHYMIISKPCNHPSTPAGKDGMIRGSYESVEFIREVPRVVKKSQSSIDLTHMRNTSASESIDRTAILRNAERKAHPFPLEHANKSQEDISDSRQRTGRSASSSPGRKRSVTVDEPIHFHGHGTSDEFESEDNPVEWIMVTRSDPGGSVPRFMVERGTPSSIVADASKFLNWATSKEHPADEEDAPPEERPDRLRQGSFQVDQPKGRLPGITEQDMPVEPTKNEPFPDLSQTPSPVESQKQMHSSGILASVTGAASAMLETYAPQAVLNHLPGHISSESATRGLPHADSTVADVGVGDDDASSTISSSSFLSADSHLGDEESIELSISSKSSPDKDPSVSTARLSQHEKELEKLHKRRATLDSKLQSARDKLAKGTDQQTEKEKEAIKKAEEKHAKELQRHEEKYKNQISKLEQKRERDAKKLEEKKKRAADKDEKARIIRERDEAKEELKLLKLEKELWLKQVGALQSENTTLASKVGKLEALLNTNGIGVPGTPVRNMLDEENGIAMRTKTATLDGENRSRSSSLKSATRKAIGRETAQ
jgi:Protein of unknown function (DUF3074)